MSLEVSIQLAEAPSPEGAILGCPIMDDLKSGRRGNVDAGPTLSARHDQSSVPQHGEMLRDRRE